MEDARPEIKSFLLSSQITFIKALIEGVERMKETEETNCESHCCPNEVEQECEHNQALQKVIDYLKEEIKI